jgi:hypothetical protein
MDISKLDSFFNKFVECLNRDKVRVKKLFLVISQVFSNPSGMNFGKLLKDFPFLNLLQWIKDQIPELILSCSPLGDQTDGQMRCLSTALNGQTFAQLLSEALSDVDRTILLYQSLEQLALQLPKIGIAELLVSSPLFPTNVVAPTSTCGMTVIPSKECADVDYLHLTEEKKMKVESSLPERLSQALDLCEASPPKKRVKTEILTSKDCSSKSIFK